MKASAKDLRFHSKEILDAITRGEEIIITYRGKPRARIIPFEQLNHNITDDHNLFGIWKDNDKIKDVRKYVRELRKGRL